VASAGAPGCGGESQHGCALDRREVEPGVEHVADVARSRVPQIAHSGNNSVVVGWRNETVELGSPDGVELGDIMIARSTDGGVSFGSAVALAAKNSTYTYGNFVLFTEPETQDIYAYIARFPADAPDARTPPECIGFKSTNGGASWAAISVVRVSIRSETERLRSSKTRASPTTMTSAAHPL
jgi:hypothetical protein